MDRMSFERWLGWVDAHLLRRIGLTHTDIADQTWHDWYDSGYAPVDAATEAMENEGMYL
ncbi:hypothetical protein X828_gp018 [Mycobacterium phage Artemis2UCLA]|uniref:hypothetical protein n=1 Tax=Mycobacterium phage Artemis2UCLA TaxID=1391429 RepID=UPI0003C94DBA|nr:hypothetical protein X828_gp018 [Mycobacterium phage Artemis2UCLA]AHB29989.1 hypothetical protein ARTEMIS2UCLA_96 [Mycobacterium phage Artemis2UCLA]AOT24829.1 hypothetical protein PBI_ISIPHIWO_91 [Mycobacterium phage Isiphiwo]